MWLKAEDGKQAIDIANIQQPDVILMDMMMPRMDGLTACHVIKNDPATKIDSYHYGYGHWF